jgi:hypothetical protein
VFMVTSWPFACRRLQALKASFVNAALEGVAEHVVRFDEDLPHFKSVVRFSSQVRSADAKSES